MSKATTIVLLLLLILGLGAFVLLAETPEAPPSVPDRFLEFAPSQVTEIEGRTAVGSFRLRREADDGSLWRLDVKGTWVRAESVEVLTLLKEMEEIEPANLFKADSTKPEDRKTWGLDKPVAELKLKSPSGEVTASFGAHALGNRHVYALRGGSEDVFLVPSEALVALERMRVENLRESRPLRFPVGDVRNLRLERTGESPFEAQNLALARWEVTLPYRGEAEPASFEAWVASLLEIEVLDYVQDGAPDLDRYGLLEPAARVTVHRNGREAPLVVAFGREAPQGRRYFRLEGEESVWTCSGSLAGRILSFDAQAVRDRNLLRIGWAKLESISMKYSGDEAWKLLLVHDRWDLDVPERTPADGEQVEALLDLLRRVDVGEFLDGEDPARHGLGGPDESAGRLDLVGLDAAGTRVLLLGRPATPGGPVPVRVLPGPGMPAGSPVALVEGKVLDALRGGWFRFRDREVMRFEKGNLRSLSRTTAGGSETWNRAGDAWTPASGPEVAETVLLDKVADRLQSLRCERWVGRLGEDAARYGLDDDSKPVSIAVTTAPPGNGPTTTVTLVIGSPAGPPPEEGAPDTRGRYARIVGVPYVFILPSTLPGPGGPVTLLPLLLGPWSK